MTIETISTSKAHGGVQGVYAHDSAVTGTRMTFSVFVPKHEAGETLPEVEEAAAAVDLLARVVDAVDRVRPGVAAVGVHTRVAVEEVRPGARLQQIVKLISGFGFRSSGPP